MASLAPSDDYASVSDLLEADTLPEQTLTLFGKKIRVRGLNLVEREEARSLAWLPGGRQDAVKIVRAYLRAGIVSPQMDDGQIDRLIRKHAASIEQVYVFIDNLTELDYAQIATAALGIGEPSQDSADNG